MNFITNDVLYVLIRANAALYQRFGVEPTLNLQLRLLEEEVREVKDAAGAEPLDREHLAEEMGDVLFVMMGLARWAGLSHDDLMTGLETVVAKNAAKTHETHYVDSHTKKIKRLAVVDATQV